MEGKLRKKARKEWVVKNRRKKYFLDLYQVIREKSQKIL